MKALVPRIVELRAGESQALLFAFSGFFFLLCGYYLLRPLRDAMGLAGGSAQLPWLFSATFLVMLILVPLYGTLARHLPPARFVPLVFRFFALNILLFSAWFASGVQPIVAGRVFFVWLSVYNLFVVSVFWSSLADRFSAEQGRRLFAFIAAGGSMGALAGPAMTAGLATSAGPAAIALLAALMLEVTVHCYVRLPRADAANEATPPLGGDAFNGLLLLVKNPYLSGVALYFLLHTFSSTFLYLEQAKIVAAASADTGQRAQLFALVDLAVSCTSLFLQLFVTSRLLKNFGLALGLAVLPVVGWLAFLACALWPGLPMLAAAQATRRACDYAISRPAREVLFTVTSREAKYKAKSAIETVVYRAGDATSGWLFAAASSVGIGLASLAWIMLPVSVFWAGLSVWLARRKARM